VDAELTDSLLAGELPSDDEPPSTRPFLAALGLHLWAEGGLTHGRATIGPGLAGPGSDRPRAGALATMVDVVAGLHPTGTVHPTIDLNVRLLRDPPTSGDIHLVCHPIKAGRRLWLGEVLIDDGHSTFAQGVVTFGNNHDPRVAYEFVRPRQGEVQRGPFDSWLSPTFVDRSTVVIEKSPYLSNWGSGTIQGGAQATLAEIAAEWVLVDEGAFVIDELDIRYVGVAKVGPVAARAELVGLHGDRAIVRVRLTDLGTDGSEVAFVSTVCRKA
jgi:acyl-coenzyme A thioesterase PaaI-like protein